MLIANYEQSALLESERSSNDIDKKNVLFVFLFKGLAMQYAVCLRVILVARLTFVMLAR